MSERKSRPVNAMEVPPRAKASAYPPPFAERVAGRRKRALGEAFGLTQFGVNLTTLAPGAQSALLHRHSHQQEFIYVLSGNPTLRTDQGEFLLGPGMCVGFLPDGNAHHLINTSDKDVQYLEIGDRHPEDQGFYPEDDLAAVSTESGWRFARKDGSAW